MKLKGRLKLIAHKVPLCEIVCDVGTDHAYIPIYLLQNKICKKAIATDVRKGPVLIANKNIKKYELEEVVETRIGSGLDCIEKGEADIIIIAGMGGMLISDLLKANAEKAKSADALILQPMNSIELVREWLYKNGFSIDDEELVAEGEKIYNIILTSWTGKIISLNKIYNYIGRKLIEKDDPLLKKYIQKKLNQVKRIVTGLKNTNGYSEETKTYLWLYEELSNLLE